MKSVLPGKDLEDNAGPLIFLHKFSMNVFELYSMSNNAYGLFPFQDQMKSEAILDSPYIIPVTSNA